MRFAVLVSVFLSAACASSVPSRDANTILLVRHAETEGGGSDPILSAAGRARAEALAELLAREGIERILTTDYHRTRSTAQPIAARLGIEPEIYDPRALPQLAADLRERSGIVLVVGHSNTTPELARLLGGDPGEAIREDEHDRLYRIDPASGRTRMTRFEAP